MVARAVIRDLSGLLTTAILYSDLEGYDLGVRVQNGTLDTRITIPWGKRYLEAIQEQLLACGIHTSVMVKERSHHLREQDHDSPPRMPVINSPFLCL